MTNDRPPHNTTNDRTTKMNPTKTYTAQLRLKTNSAPKLTTQTQTTMLRQHATIRTAGDCSPITSQAKCLSRWIPRKQCEEHSRTTHAHAPLLPLPDMTRPWNIKVIVINVNGIKTDMWNKLRTIHKQRHDVILLQETKLMHEDLNDDLVYRWKQISDGEAYTSRAASSQSGGVAILLSAHGCELLTNREAIPSTTARHRHLTLKARLQEHVVYIHTIYAPVLRTERPHFFNSLPITATSGSHLIGGDFNCTMDTQLDTVGDKTIAAYGSAELSAWLAALGANDVWRTQHDTQMEFTSPSGLSRIDMLFASGCFLNNYVTHHAPRTIGSDHLCPTATFTSSDIRSRGGHWQLPIWAVPTAAQQIKPTLQHLVEKTTQPNYLARFTKTMRDITAQCQATHKRLIRWRKNRAESAKLRWLRAHTRALHSPTDELIQDAERARMAWRKEIDEENQRKRRWAFEKHFAEAERCTRFFFARARPNRATIIPGVKMPDGAVRTDRASIQTSHYQFWTNLYSVNSNGTEPLLTQQNLDALTNTNIPHLSETAIQLLEFDVTKDDIVRQIGLLPTHKAAGSDGLRAELFKSNPKLWAKALLPIFTKHLHEEMSLPQSFQESVIILLHKKGCPLRPENYRPIALLNVIAKILSGIHTQRLRKVIGSVIPHEQTGFVPGRSITENIITLQDAIHYAKRHHPTSIILALDFAKAYDRVQWNVMIAIMKKMGFGPKWLTTISTMYKNRNAQLSINGELIFPFPIERGVLQGDPLSPSLFILQCSPLYKKLSDARDRHGIPLPNGEAAPVATFYADDTNIIARSPSSAVRLYDIANWFCMNSGAKLHQNKCVAIPTGPAPPHLENGIKILAPTQHTSILGIQMGQTISRDRQVEGVIKKMVDKCKKWTHVGRTIEGRITVARSILLPTLWYTMAALPTIPDEAKKIQIIINNYINRKEQTGWGGTTTRGNMSNDWFYRPIASGGWGLSPTLRTLRARKLAMIKSFMNDQELDATKPWHTFVKHMLAELLAQWGGQWQHIFMWEGLKARGDAAIGDWNALSPWWRDAWQEWLKLGCTPIQHSIPRPRLTRWPVWNNRILAHGHGLRSSLRLAFSNSSTRTHMATIRRAGFTTFRDFTGIDGTIITGEQLYSLVTVHSSVHEVDHVVPRWACDTLIRHIKALWANVLHKWLRLSTQTQQQHHTTQWLVKGSKTPFIKMTNKSINKALRELEPQRPPPHLLKIRQTPAAICWKRESSSLRALAPSRRDLIRRIIRNALPLGVKRTHWATQAQTTCLLCQSGAIETAQHLFWYCSYAKETWLSLPQSWRTHRRTHITWDEVVTGTEVRLGNQCNTQIGQLWAIIRACTLRTIWFERNRRYFYPQSPTKTPTFRHHQALDDITIHVECWFHRSEGKVKEHISRAVTTLKQRSNTYNDIKLNPQHTI